MGIATLTKSAELVSPDLHILTQEELRSLQMLLLEMTSDIAQICQENNIPWSLGGGSLLGAVRHKGFIPWDDDMDLTMLREDFERFKKVFPGRFSDKYELKLPGDKGYMYHFPKVYRKNTIAQTIQSSPDETECVSVDIFIMENVSDNLFVRTAHGILCTGLLLADSVMRMKRCEAHLLRYGAGSPELCKAVKKRSIWAGLFGFLSLEQWLKLSDRVFSLCKDTNSKHIVIPSGNGHFFGEIFSKAEMTDLSMCEFEHECLWQIRKPEYYLELRYGPHYYQIPPESEREYHAFVRIEFFRSWGN